MPGVSAGPQHWQSFWEREHPAFQRLQHRDWDTPDRSDWVATLQDAIAASTTPVILVAHSLACCLVAHWSAAHTGPIQGALLVVPSDVEADTYPLGTTGFARPHAAQSAAPFRASSWGARGRLDASERLLRLLLDLYSEHSMAFDLTPWPRSNGRKRWCSGLATARRLTCCGRRIR